LVDEVRRQALAAFADLNVGADGESLVFGEVRYVGQSHEMAVAAGHDWALLRDLFEESHRSRFGFDRPGEAIELVDLRAEVTGAAALTWHDLPSRPSGPAPEAVGTTSHGATVWDREHLPAGFETRGPALIVERDSVTLLGPDDTLSVHDDGTLEVRV
jgi:N-methylhydantoinase A/oxoprolinase/acetone carboxylase beta subunit